jgi:hypothetical protein
MLRDDRLGHTGPCRQHPDRLLSFAAEPLEDRPPSRIGECPEKRILRH